MPTDVSSRLSGPANAAIGDSTLFTVDDGHTVILARVKIVNNTAAKVTLKFGINGTTDDLLIMPPIGIPKTGILDVPTTDILNQTDTLQVNATATGTTVTVYGIDRYPHF